MFVNNVGDSSAYGDVKPCDALIEDRRSEDEVSCHSHYLTHVVHPSFSIQDKTNHVQLPIDFQSWRILT